ncbi:dihydroorotase [Natronomonas marina]|uniref:dihydroorotase n=1 Tax=Natronomonas marina TaxID=2961939 RepID=UPI0020C9FD7F|nr:amidohydrolase family protein [Natronomonas marina]
MSHDLVVSNGTVVTPEQGRFEADIAADDGVVSNVAAPGTLGGDTEVDATGKYVLPGAIDPHTHHGIYREFTTDAIAESRSDLVGGVTTVGVMLSFQRGLWDEFVPTYLEEAEGRYYHDYFLTLDPTSIPDVSMVDRAIEEWGVTTFKWFPVRKDGEGPEDGSIFDGRIDDFVARLAAREESTTLAYHSENAEITTPLKEHEKASGRDEYASLVDAFPGRAEAQSMVAGSALTRQHDYDDSFYAVHISSKETANEIAALREAGYRTTGETCPHYLALTTSEADDRAKVNPPVRDERHQEVLWERVADGTISCIGTDHCPNDTDEKIGDDIWDSLWGFPGTTTMLPLILSEGVNEGRISLERAVEVTSTNTAKAWNVFPKKGTIRVGSDADLAVVDLDETKTVTTELLQSGCDYTPYEGMSVTGWPTQTIVRGEVAYEDGEVVGEAGHGEYIRRPV